MQKIRSFFAFEQKNSNFFLDMDLVSKYSLVVFALLFIHSFRVEHDYLVKSTHLYYTHFFPAQLVCTQEATVLPCSPNFPRAFILRHTHAKHGLILYWYMHVCLPLALSSARCRQIVFRYFYCLYLPPDHPSQISTVSFINKCDIFITNCDRTIDEPANLHVRTLLFKCVVYMHVY